MPQQEIYVRASENKMKDDNPIPDDVEGEKKIKKMWRIKNARLKRGKQRNTGIIIWVPERHFARSYK